MRQARWQFVIFATCCFLVLSGCGTVGADWPSPPAPSPDAGLADVHPDDVGGPTDAEVPDTGIPDAGIPDTGPWDADTLEAGLTDVVDVYDVEGDDVSSPDQNGEDVWTGIAGCVSCHTNEPLLMELAPPEPPEEEEGGGG